MRSVRKDFSLGIKGFSNSASTRSLFYMSGNSYPADEIALSCNIGPEAFDILSSLVSGRLCTGSLINPVESVPLEIILY